MPEIITRAEAKVRGLKRYFDGTCCLHGHVAERLVSNKACVRCAVARGSAWRDKKRLDPEFRAKERADLRERMRVLRADPAYSEKAKRYSKECVRARAALKELGIEV